MRIWKPIRIECPFDSYILFYAQWPSRIYGHLSFFISKDKMELTNQFWCWNPDSTLHIALYWSKFWRYGFRFMFWDIIKTKI